MIYSVVKASRNIHPLLYVTTMVIHLMRVKVAPQTQSNAVRTIKSMIGTTKAKSGCLTCSLYTLVDNEDELLLVENWDSQMALDEHIRSKQYGLLLEVMELAVEKPLVAIHDISRTRGLEYIKELRLKHPSQKTIQRFFSTQQKTREIR